MSIQSGVSELSITFYGGRIGVAAGIGTSRRGTEKPTKTPYVGFQEIVDPQEIGSTIKNGAPEFTPRLYLFFRKKESIDVVIRALERAKLSFDEIEAEEKAKAGVFNAKDDSKPGVSG